MNLGVWSGPRNLSTAMMYSFAQRSDTTVWDEPFYAAYLVRTGLDHPVRDEIIATYENDPAKVIAKCTETRAGIFYQKQMCQHFLAGDDMSWIASLTNVLLIRHPQRVIASYDAKRENPVAGDLGFAMQARLYDLLIELGQQPIIIDAGDIRENPERMLTALCDAIGISFEPTMLSWPKGGIADDGIWAKHWYPAVHNSTGFAGAEGPMPALPQHLQSVLSDCLPDYERLFEKRLTA